MLSGPEHMPLCWEVRCAEVTGICASEIMFSWRSWCISKGLVNAPESVSHSRNTTGMSRLPSCSHGVLLLQGGKWCTLKAT